MPDYESGYMRDRGHSCKKSAQGMGKEFIVGVGGVTQGTFVKFSGGDDITVVTCGLQGAIVGVAMDTRTVGQTVEVQQDGFHWIQVGTAANLVVGDWVVSDATGMAIEFTCPLAGTDTTQGGYILSAPAEDDDCVCLKIQLKKACEISRA